MGLLPGFTTPLMMVLLRDEDAKVHAVRVGDPECELAST